MVKELDGFVEHKIFQTDNGFGIYRISLLEGAFKEITIKGPLFTLEPETAYRFYGSYHEDPRYGLQFNVSHFEKIIPKETDFVLRYLSGPSFPGVGIKSAQALVDKYGSDILEQIKNDPSLELSIPGLGKDKLEHICRVIREQDPIDAATTYLIAQGFSSKQVLAITKKYDIHTLKILEENPYRLVYEVHGVGFKSADKLGKELGFTEKHPERLQALVLDLYQNIAFRRGDSFIYLDELLEKAPVWLYPYVTESIQGLIAKRQLVFDDSRLYHITQFESEVYIANFLNDFVYQGNEFDIPHFDEVFAEVEDSLNINFDPQQVNAIKAFLKNDTMILTGGPGTGKSTLLSAIVKTLQITCPWLHITLCAPTGRAAKRLTELTNVHAATVHSVLKWDPDTNEFAYNLDHQLETDIMIIDEFSMVDTWLFANLLQASNHVKKFLFVGDQDQLPSVGPGFVLGDMIHSGAIATTVLERNYRQEAGSEVVDLAMHVKAGQFAIENYHQDVHFYDRHQIDVQEQIAQIVKASLDQGYSIEEVQILAPKYDGRFGIHTLNHFLQKTFNPPAEHKNERLVGSHIFREGDKILQLKNQPDDFVFNGDVGILAEVDEKQLVVDFEGNFVTYENADLIKITHAYAMSVHKAQGSEYPVVILLAVPEYGMMLSRRLYYTGMTRSSQHLHLIGDLESFKKAAHNQIETLRYTALDKRLVK
ncbi:MAG TPA: ATP-dependent RecD-like DNA helicase [Erysipelothrix sp.]